MNWKLKALIQQAVGALPDTVSYPLYYGIQRGAGGLRDLNPTDHLLGGIGVVRRICREHRQVESRSFLEIGTGRQVNLPIALWLCGASRIVTVDLNPYLKAALVFESLDYVRRHRREVERLFDGVQRPPSFDERFEQLLSARRDLDGLLAMLNVEYLAPSDATRLPLADASIDYHVSFTVLEHVSPRTLDGVLVEGRRVLRPSGLFVHFVDFSDHFSHADPSITAVNFLQFDERRWRRLAGNRYAYHNRLRVDEFLDAVRRAGVGVVSLEPRIDPRGLSALESGFRVDQRFAPKTAETNATVDAWLVGSP